MNGLFLLLVTKMVTFGGGCFWCVEEAFDKAPGVVNTTSGYMGGDEASPTYDEVSAGKTGHFEVVQVEYDPSQTSYQDLLQVFWNNIDPANREGQFCDIGSQYRSVIFYGNEEEKQLAEASKAAFPLKPNYTLILPKKEFWPAEEYHQNFYQKNPIRFRFYKNLCGRQQRLDEIRAMTSSSSVEGKLK